VFFLSLEYAELSYNGVGEYFSDPWNFVDSTQFIIYLTHISIETTKDVDQYGAHDSHALWGNLVTITCLFMCTIKLMQFLRYNENFGFLIQMILTVFIDLFPFLTIFVVLVFFFSLVMVITDADFERDDYSKVDRFICLFLQVFRNSVGDIGAVRYKHWLDAEQAGETTKGYAMLIIWFFWVVNIFIMLIVMLNFLIAEVSQTYDKVKGQGKMLLYQKKAELNLLACKIFKMFGRRSSFKVLVFTGPKHEADLADDEAGFGLTAAIQKETYSAISRLKQDLAKNHKRIQDSVKDNEVKNDTLLKAQESYINQRFSNIEKLINHSREPVEEEKSNESQAPPEDHSGSIIGLLTEMRAEMRQQKKAIGQVSSQMMKVRLGVDAGLPQAEMKADEADDQIEEIVLEKPDKQPSSISSAS